MRRQFIPFLITLLAAFLCGDSASRLHLLAVLFARPVLTLAFTALLLFVVQRSADICRSLLVGGVGGDFAQARLSRLPRWRPALNLNGESAATHVFPAHSMTAIEFNR
jgi:hypothetical protein